MAVDPEMVRVVHVVPQPLCGRLEPEAQQGLHVQAAVPSPPGQVAAVQIESYAVVDGGGSPRVPPSPRRISVVEGKNITSEPSADQCCGGEKITSEPSADQCGGGEKDNLRALIGSVLWRGKKITSEPSVDQCCGGEKITSEPSADQWG